MKKQNLTQYEVVFVVQGYLKAEDGDIGELTCNGLIDGRENCQIRQLQTCTRNQKSRPRSALRLRRRLSAVTTVWYTRAQLAVSLVDWRPRSSIKIHKGAAQQVLKPAGRRLLFSVSVIFLFQHIPYSCFKIILYFNFFFRHFSVFLFVHVEIIRLSSLTHEHE